MINDVALPERMKDLPLDKRGYPIPVIVMRDDQGKPLFAVNDAPKRAECTLKKLCPICGQRLDKKLWFVGGPQSAFHPFGCYYDSAMHYECMRYALQVCPYLAMRYATRDEQVRLNSLQAQTAENIKLIDITQSPGKPFLLVAVAAFAPQFEKTKTARGLRAGDKIFGVEVHQQIYIRPLRPYHQVEFWKDGTQLSFEEGLEKIRTDANQIKRIGGEEPMTKCLRLILRSREVAV